jgi:hypothetical protein
MIESHAAFHHALPYSHSSMSIEHDAPGAGGVAGHCGLHGPPSGGVPHASALADASADAPLSTCPAPSASFPPSAGPTFRLPPQAVVTAKDASTIMLFIRGMVPGAIVRGKACGEPWKC